jgi:hypothetical protein
MISFGHFVRERSGTALDADVGTGNEHGLVSVIPADLEPPVRFVAEDLDDFPTAFRLADLL